MPRTLAIGDVHGCHVALESLLDLVAPEAEDTVVMLGDVVDRGPGSKQAIDRLLCLREECRAVFLMGNHEEMMLKTLDEGIDDAFWLRFGGLETLESYGGRKEDVPEGHLEFLRDWVDYHETETELFVHANWDPGRTRVEQDASYLRWLHLQGVERPLPSGKRVVCGHTSQKDGVVKTLEGWVCIDTFPAGGKWLTCLDCGTDELWQANQQGETRGPLELAEASAPLTR